MHFKYSFVKIFLYLVIYFIVAYVCYDYFIRDIFILNRVNILSDILIFAVFPSFLIALIYKNKFCFVDDGLELRYINLFLMERTFKSSAISSYRIIKLLFIDILIINNKFSMMSVCLLLMNNNEIKKIKKRFDKLT